MYRQYTITPFSGRARSDGKAVAVSNEQQQAVPSLNAADTNAKQFPILTFARQLLDILF